MLKWLDLSGSSNRYRQMYIKGFLDISGGNLVLRNNHLQVLTGDASFGNNIYVANTANINKIVVNDVSVNGNINISYLPDSIPATSIKGGIPQATGVFSTDLSLNSRLSVASTSIFNGLATMNGLVVNGPSQFINTAQFSSKTVFNSDASLNANLYVNGTIYNNGVSLNSKFAPLNSPTFTGTVGGITAAMVGLSNVDNTNDLSKPVSTATQNAINLVVGNPPNTMNTLQSLAQALTNDPSFGTNLTNSINASIIGKASITNPSFITAITTAKLFATSDTSLNTRLFVAGDTSMNGNLKVGRQIFEGGQSLVSKYATLVSPTFTGTVIIPTAQTTNLTVSSDASLNARLSLNGDISANSALFLQGNASLGSQLTVAKSANFKGDVSMNSRLSVTSDASLNGNVEINKQLQVGGNANILGQANFADVSLNNNVDISGAIMAHNNINVFGVINQQTMNIYDGVLTTFDSAMIQSVGALTGLVNIVTGSTNTIIGKNAGQTSGTNTTVIGYQAAPSSATVSNEITLGNSSVTTLRCGTNTITSLSDGRDKSNVENLAAGIEFIKALKPVSFEWNMRDGGKVGAKEIGFIAQDLLTAQESAGISIPNLVSAENPDRLEASYGTLIPVLVKAMQDMQREIDMLKGRM